VNGHTLLTLAALLLTSLAVGGAEAAAISASKPSRLKTLLPAATDTQSEKLDLAKFASGEVKLLLCIPKPLTCGKPVRFAKVDLDRDRAGWLTLGKILIPRHD
jgi:hypothetical protein